MQPVPAFLVVVAFFGMVHAEPPKNDAYNYEKPTIAFVLPARQRLPVALQLSSYGAPQRISSPVDTYGPPEDKYEPPATELTPPEAFDDVESREAVLTTTTEMPTTTETPQKEAQQIRDTEEVEDSEKDEGVYYIYHPTGLLQRIVYSTKDDARNMAYTAQFRYKDVEPISDPIYTYDPETLVLRQIVA